MSLLIKNIKELATACGNTAKKGAMHGDVTILNDVCVAVVDGKIAYIGDEKNAPKCEETIDATDKLVTPGLVDAHTHLVFGGWRQKELELKLNGATYLDILQAGGGILSTVTNTRQESEEELTVKSIGLLDEMLSYGTTSVEVKSGYGLELDTELKQLNVIKKLQEQSCMDVVSTFMGAHAFPTELKDNHEEYVRIVMEEMLPAVAKREEVEFCDIFCETAVFNPAQTEKILTRAKELGLKIKLHGDEIDYIGGGELAGKLKCTSAEHLIQASDEGIKAMAEASTVGILLPATSFYLDKPYARARKMIDENMSIAVATDFNPGSSPNLNLQFPMTLACLKYKLTPKEALTAVTLNPAAALGLSDRVGTLEVGKQADIVIWNAPDLNYLFYRYGSNQVSNVIKNGVVVK